jgi:hypothetical protein
MGSFLIINGIRLAYEPVVSFKLVELCKKPRNTRNLIVVDLGFPGDTVQLVLQRR